MEINIDVEEASAKFELMEISWTDPVFKDEETAVKVSVRNYGGKDGTVTTTLYASGSMVDSGWTGEGRVLHMGSISGRKYPFVSTDRL